MPGEAEAGTVAGTLARPAPLRPVAPGPAETVLWEGRPSLGAGRLFELLFLLVLLGLLTWTAVLLIAPHLGGSAFAGQPGPEALPVILLLVIGTVIIIALPVWLRASARGRARYMLTNRRALVWLGRSVIGEAILFGAEMEVTPTGVGFWSHGLYLDWRLKDERPDQLRFERLADPETVAAIAEAQGARRLPPPEAGA
ncbi:MAG: hypothetical protein ACK4MT_04610 [Thermaurantiacus tibetensis]|uniref:hypothetical protein n=1 Tax=Thermaurantiacus tibetensis TaxID=2759035 RepID=UPI00188FF08D|nr:hypothetical protein [Thermaurantiacus tibetensis]